MKDYAQFLKHKFFQATFLSLFSVGFCNAQDTLKLDYTSPGLKIPGDFPGMAYESDALHFDSLKLSNHTLIQYFKTAGIKTFRLGGNSVENYVFTLTEHGFPPDSVTTSELDSMFQFASAVGCKIILGLNFGGDSNPSVAAKEANYVMYHDSALLLAFEIGNEPNLYYRNGLRLPSYTYYDYQRQFLLFVDSIRKYHPGAPICGPSAARLQAALYTDPFVHYMYLNKGIINLLTQHNYSVPIGMPTGMEIDSLLSHYTIDSIRDLTETLVKQGDSDNVPFQMDECNALYNGGQWGVSNSLACALWSLDYMFTLAKAGANGCNFHTTYDTNATIINDVRGVYSARAPFYGIVAFQLGSKGRFIPDTYKGTAKNLDIFPVIDSINDLFVTLINKDTANPVTIQVYADSMIYKFGSYVELTAPTVSDTVNITLAGTTILPNGTWTPGPSTTAPYSHGYFSVTVPHATATILKLFPSVTGIDVLRAKSEEVRVYPNPNNGIFTIALSHAELISAPQPIVEIYNIMGQKVYVASLPQTSRNDFGTGSKGALSEINLSSQPNGVYLYRVLDENGSIISNGKFVIEK